MRGGLVARLGDPGSDIGRLESIAGQLRWHGGQPAAHDSGPLQIRALVDATHGPFVDQTLGNLILAHGAEPRPLSTTARTAPRFALLEWDGRLLRASRDAFGQVPLFYRFARGALWLATEVGPLRALTPTRPDLDELAALAAGVRSPESTGWIDIRRILPGAILEVGPDLRSRTWAWWRPAVRFGRFEGSRDEAVSAFREAFRTAVDRCREGRTGILLSGGLDSTAVAVVAGALPGPKPTLVHVTHPMPSCNEVGYAQAAAEATGAPLSCVEGDLSPWNPRAELDNFALAPALTLPLGHLEMGLRSLRAAGVFNVLDGHDGDGALGRYRGIAGLFALHGQIAALNRLRRGPLVHNLARSVLADLLPPQVRMRNVRHRPSADPAGLRYFAGPVRDRLAHRYRWKFAPHAWRNDEVEAMSPTFTVAVEEMEMLAACEGIDIRHPFADPDVIRLLISLPFDAKIDPTRTKGVLRDALAASLPAPIAQRQTKIMFDDALRHRVAATPCLDLVRGSDVRLPGIDYARLLTDADRDIDSIDTHTLLRLTRAHIFARAG